jgi:hypothetical protein
LTALSSSDHGRSGQPPGTEDPSRQTGVSRRRRAAVRPRPAATRLPTRRRSRPPGTRRPRQYWHPRAARHTDDPRAHSGTSVPSPVPSTTRTLPGVPHDTDHRRSRTVNVRLANPRLATERASCVSGLADIRDHRANRGAPARRPQPTVECSPQSPCRRPPPPRAPGDLPVAKPDHRGSLSPSGSHAAETFRPPA